MQKRDFFEYRKRPALLVFAYVFAQHLHEAIRGCVHAIEERQGPILDEPLQAVAFALARGVTAQLLVLVPGEAQPGTVASAQNHDVAGDRLGLVIPP